jgi:glutathione S-transferase
MIDLYSWRTPNGYKASIMLEEVGLPYEVHPVDITRGDQFKPELVAINPNSKIPAIVDREGLAGEYSVADVASYPWVASALTRLGDAARERIDALAHVKRWASVVGERGAVKKGMTIPAAT